MFRTLLITNPAEQKQKLQIHMKSLYRDNINLLSINTKILIVIGLILIFYGFLARRFEIYIFWESRFIGVLFLFVASFFVLFNINKKNVKINKNLKLITNILTTLFLLYILIILITVVIFHFSDAYKVVLKDISKNEKLVSEIGEIKSIDKFPTGGLSIKSNEKGTFGIALISIIIKGSKKYTDADIIVKKYYDSNKWVIEKVIW